MRDVLIALGSHAMSLVDVTVTAERPVPERDATADRLARLVRPALGLLLPVGAALLWEIGRASCRERV